MLEMRDAAREIADRFVKRSFERCPLDCYRIGDNGQSPDEPIRWSDEDCEPEDSDKSAMFDALCARFPDADFYDEYSEVAREGERWFRDSRRCAFEQAADAELEPSRVAAGEVPEEV
jgi:hypothetical protein